MSLWPSSDLCDGHGRVRISADAAGRPSLSELAFAYPLKLMCPKNAFTLDAALAPGLISLYMISYGGGLVSGDIIHLDMDIEAACHLVLLTQGSTKVFRNRPGGSYSIVNPSSKNGSSVTTKQILDVNIAANASLFLLPAPVTCFEKASYSQTQTFHLEDSNSSNLLLLDWYTSGRMSRGESWAFEKYRSANSIYVSGQKVINDVLLLDQGKTTLQSRMAGYACYCTLFVYGTVLQPLLDHFQTLTRGITQYKLREAPKDIMWSYSELDTPQKYGVVRCAGSETEVVKDWLEKNLLPIRDIIGKDTYKAAFV